MNSKYPRKNQNDGVRKRNGEVVINALRNLGEPATLNKILQHIVNQHKVVFLHLNVLR